jgi:hypothetical protein
VLQRSAQNGRWEGVLRLGQATEGPLAVRGHWGAWAETLKRELEAARQLGDRAAEAWSLHQSGTRALCLEDAPTARRDLSEALRLRESLGDREGAAVTRHNLKLLGGFGGNDGLQGNGSGGGAGSRALWPLIVGTIVVVAILALIAAALGEEIWPTSPGNESPPGRDRPGGGGGDQTGGGGGDQTGGGLDTTGLDTTQGGSTGLDTTGLDTTQGGSTGVGTIRGGTTGVGTGTTTGETHFPYETSYKGA